MGTDIKADIASINVITNAVIGCAYKVSNTLGAGFLEKVYENALAHEISKTGMKVTQQQRISVTYDGMVVGDFLADLIFCQSSVFISVHLC